MLARCRCQMACGVAVRLLPLVVLALLVLVAAGPVRAYDDAPLQQCQSHVYPLDGSTLKPVRKEGAPQHSSPSTSTQIYT